VRDPSDNQSGINKATNEPLRVPKSRQARIWLFAFGLIAFGLFCIASISPNQEQPTRTQDQELFSKGVSPISPVAAELLPRVLEATKPVTNSPESVDRQEPKIAESIPSVSKEQAVIHPEAKQLMPTHTKQEPLLKKEKNGAKAAQPKVTAKSRPVGIPAFDLDGATVTSRPSETSASQVSMGTSSGMPSQTLQSTTTSNKADACYGTNGLSREQCQQCDSRNGWLFKLNCEAQVKTRFCAGREGKHVECPPSYHTPG
jgi:hypothetical protein